MGPSTRGSCPNASGSNVILFMSPVVPLHKFPCPETTTWAWESALGRWGAWAGGGTRVFNIAVMSVGGRRRGKSWVALLGSSLMTEHTNQDSTETRLPRRHTMDQSRWMSTTPNQGVRHWPPLLPGTTLRELVPHPCFNNPHSLLCRTRLTEWVWGRRVDKDRGNKSRVIFFAVVDRCLSVITTMETVGG